jgi:hypothetical protein
MAKSKKSSKGRKKAPAVKTLNKSKKPKADKSSSYFFGGITMAELSSGTLMSDPNRFEGLGTLIASTPT